MNKEITSAIKLATVTTISLLATRYLSRMNQVRQLSPTSPEIASMGASLLAFAGSVKLAKKMKDPSIRLGVQAGTGISALTSILSMPAISSKLPAEISMALAGDSSNGITVGTDELEAIIQTELQRRIESVLPKGVTTTEPLEIELNGNTVDGDEIYSELDGEEIYSTDW